MDILVASDFSLFQKEEEEEENNKFVSISVVPKKNSFQRKKNQATTEHQMNQKRGREKTKMSKLKRDSIHSLPCTKKKQGN